MSSPSSAGRPRRTSRSRAAVPPLTDLDHRILSLLARHRVLTQNQLAAIEPGTPVRTLRYRCARLAKGGLAGRTRPYRERGSAPHHLWPTRKGEAIACGGPPPRGGERREPNPLFLAHAAGLTEIYVALIRALPEGTELVRFDREAEAREPFSTWRKPEKRAIAPDVFIEIADRDGGTLLAFVELDRGTMSHRRLKQKAAGYAAYAEERAWRERHDFCPALLFATTTEMRARSFLAVMEKELGRDGSLLTSASDLARRLGRFATEPRWLLGSDEDGRAMDLLAALREARRPYDEAREEAAANRREREARCERLQSDPEALRQHLRRYSHRDWDIKSLGKQAARALEVTLERDGPLAEVERRALAALGSLFADPLSLRLVEREVSDAERWALDDLCEHHREEQRRTIIELAERLGEGPQLREAARRLHADELLRDSEASRLERRAEEDRDSRAEQKRLATDYLAWREEEARRLLKAQGLTARLSRRPDDFLDRIDRRSLRRCETCEEIAYPDPERTDKRWDVQPEVAERCHFCGGTTALAELGEEGGES